MKKILVAIAILAALLVVSYAASKLIGVKGGSDYIAVIPINGIITIEGNGLGFNAEGTSSSEIVSFIKKANDNSAVKAIILEINSPGGTAVASREIAEAVKNSEKPVVSLIREVGASGAYWIASASEAIVADPLSITGSIGATGSYLQFSELFEKYGVTYERLVSGEYKDTGNPFKELSEKERKLLQSKIDQIHDVFVEAVSDNRNMQKNDIEKLATGEFYLGKEALELGLVDHLGGMDFAIDITEEIAGIEESEIVRYESQKGFFDLVGGLSVYSSYFIGKGIGSELKTSSYDVPVRLE